MTKLDQLISELCPDGVEYQSLGKVLKNNNASNSVSRRNYREAGRIPIIDQSQAYIAAYTDNESAVPPVLPCIIFGDHTRVVKYVDQKFAQGDSGTKVLVPVSENYNSKYVFYAFCNLSIPSRGYNRHWSIVKDIRIPLPPLPVQREIVRILDNFTELTKELTTELTARKKQFEYYRDELFAFDDSVEWMALGEICELLAGGDVPKDHFSKTETEEYTVPIYSNGIGNNALYGYTDIAKVNTPSVTISARGTIGYSALRKEPYYPIIRLICAVPKKDVCAEYLQYVVQTISFQVPTAGIPQLTVPMVAKYKVPVPSLEVQKHIVTILDRFDTLCNDLTSGLPAEIEARRKQYEYYRDKLLTFKEASA